MAEEGVSGSMRPVLWFVNNGTEEDKQLTSAEQMLLSGIPTTVLTKVLNIVRE